jgi:hypothetical protein
MKNRLYGLIEIPLNLKDYKAMNWTINYPEDLKTYKPIMQLADTLPEKRIKL